MPDTYPCCEHCVHDTPAMGGEVAWGGVEGPPHAMPCAKGCHDA